MGLFSGARPRTEPAQTRSFTLPWSVPLVNYAAVDANGETSRQSIAVDASIDLICSLASELPVDVYRGDGSDRVKLPTPSTLRDPSGDGHDLEDWLYQVLGSWLYRGNLYGEPTEIDNSGRVRRVALFHPDDVHAMTEDGRVAWYVKGRRYTGLMMHRRVNPVAGRLLGASVIEKHALQIGTSLSAAAFGNQWFSDGAHPSGLLVNSEASLDQAQAETAKARFMRLLNGSREPVVMGKGWDYRPIQITPGESQFLETQRFTEAQCARMFGPAMAETLGYETGGSMTYANVVDRRSDLLTFTLNRWLRRAERLLTEMLPAPQYVRFNRDALLQSTTLARYEAHSRALADRWRTVNEVRDIEELPPVEWGDVPNEKTTTPTTGGTAQ